MPFGKVAGPRLGGGGTLMVMLSACEAVCAGLLLSVKITVKLAVPVGPVGVPVMAPVLALRPNPDGSDPVMLHVHGP